MVSGIESYMSFMNTGLSQTGLDTVTKQISEKTDTGIDATDVVTAYDTDGDGALSGTELESFLSATGMTGTMSTMPPAPAADEEDDEDSGDLFSQIDSDKSGGVSQTELDSLAETIASETGIELDTTDAVATYDTDGDGELSQDELGSFLDASGLQPPQGPMQQAMSAYGLNSGGGQSMEASAYETDGTYTPLSLTA